VLSELPYGDSPVTCDMRCLNFVLDGLEQYEINGRTVTVRPGEFILVEAGTTARAILPLRQVTRGLCVYLPDPQSDHGPSPLGNVFQLATADGALSRQLRAVALHLAEHPTQGSQLARRVVRGASIRLDQLVSELTPKLMRIDAARPGTRRELLEKVERARRYLHDHPYRAVALPELAAATAMSPFHLARSFCAVFGQPPARYHRRMRIGLAERELNDGNVSIQEVAQRFGFAEASSFFRARRRTKTRD
jgi:AraC-like DNA-binding protein